jgi:hypothetical protein
VIDLAVTGRYGFADERLKGAAWLSYRPSPRRSIRLGAFDELRDANDVAEVSRLRNSIAAQEFAADFTEPYHVRGVDLRAEYRIRTGLIASITVARERADSARLSATPARGTFRPLMAVPTGRYWRSEYGLALVSGDLLGGAIDGNLTLQLRSVTDEGGPGVTSRVTGRLQYQHSMGTGTIVAETFAGVTNSELPQDQVRAGGPMTAPGYAAHQFTSQALVSQRVEWRLPVPFPSIPVGRWGRSPARATLAPLASILVQEEQVTSGDQRVAGYSSIGAGLLLFFDLVRIDVARGLRNGRWTFGVDLSRDLWRIL